MGPTRQLTVKEQEARKQKSVLEKDETERQLEKILFGDQAGFLDALTSKPQDDDKALTKIRSAESGDQDGSDEDMGEVADEDLFFLDAGAPGLPDDVMEDLRAEEDEDTSDEERNRKVRWHDSDDERMTVSLASHTRLRKLRDTEDDDMVNGLEYIRRLRRQYERLHPTPDWVKYARKKQKMSNEDADSDSDSDVDISIDSTSAMSLSEILRSAGSLTRTAQEPTNTSIRRTLRLRPETIDIERQKDIASSGPSSIDAIQFHPTYPLLLTAGPSSTVTLYHVSPTSRTPNPILTSLHIKNTPLRTAIFATPLSAAAKNDQPQTKIYLSSRRRYFHIYNINSQSLNRITPSQGHSKPKSITKKPTKNHTIPTCEHLLLSPDSSLVAIISNTGAAGGTVHILSTTTHQNLHQVRIDSPNGIATVLFYRDTSGLSIIGKNGEVSEYSLAEERIMARWVDDGAVGTTTAAMGGEMVIPSMNGKSQTNIKDTGSHGPGHTPIGNDKYIAIGSTSGIVNIYDRATLTAHFTSQSSQSSSTTQIHRPTPLRTLPHLTTPTSHLLFSPDPSAQLLVLASRWKKNALRLVHMPSCTVYRNWPTERTPLGRVSSVAISPDGGYLAVGCESGRVRLWGIKD